MEINFEPTNKQWEMFEAFDDEITTEVIYGGSAGGGKSYGIMAMILLKALQYPNIRIGLARNELTTLKKTTVVSFMEVATDWGVKDLFSYNSSAGIIKFENGSEIVLCELRHLPGDEQYTRLGGHLFTFGVVDEVGEVDERGYTIFKTRLGRWKNEEFGIKPICVSTCNPIKNWLYREFYRKDVEGTLEEHKMFIQALPTDNPYLAQSYLDSLNRLPYIDRQRLLFGNWEYTDASDALMEYKDIINVWDNVGEPSGSMYLTADIAFTSDKLVIMIWQGFTVIKTIINPDVEKIEDYILQLAKEYKVPNYHIAYDSDGVGQFLKNRLRNAKPIINNAKALNGEQYQNLKTQLYYKLAEKVNDGSVKISDDSNIEEITEELQQVRHKPTTKVGKLEMVGKNEVKKVLGRSPDFSDTMAYRMVFEYKNTQMKTFVIGGV